MSKNRKKIIGTLLGIMASVSSAGAMQNAPNTGSANTGITNNKNEKQNEFKKRGEAKASRLLQALDLAVKLGLFNEVASTVPGLKRISYPIFRQVFSDYRVVHGFRGYVMRHDNPKYANNVFKLNGDDGHDFRVRVDRGENLFASGNKPCDTVEIGSSDVIGRIEKKKFQFSEYLSEPSLSLVTEAKVKNENEFHRLFEAKSIWNIDDVANAVNQANKLLDIINNQKIDAGQKKNMIVKQFGKNVVFVPDVKDKEYGIRFRILLGKKKFTAIDVEKTLKEKFFAGEIVDNPEIVQKGFGHSENKQYIDEARNELNKTLATLDKTEGLSCYAEFKLVQIDKIK